MPISICGPSTSQPGGLQRMYLPEQSALWQSLARALSRTKSSWVRGSFFISFDSFPLLQVLRIFILGLISMLLWFSHFSLSPRGTYKHGKSWHFDALTFLVSETDRWDGWFPSSCIMFTKSAERSLLAACAWGSHTFSTRNGLCC